ncbi:hypothetical protein DPMN_168036 [Dreissena polymorpha]|uniref:Uncharacterized protein n=1 Tax=Dreissena polymorpha TaxID=45954 RepID=A0A9D4IZ59_DREPO|nr:hypothetical protein DPMN_168036 [Dreissena polymorpha]
MHYVQFSQNATHIILFSVLLEQTYLRPEHHTRCQVSGCIRVPDDIEVFNGCAGETSVRSKCADKQHVRSGTKGGRSDEE